MMLLIYEMYLRVSGIPKSDLQFVRNKKLNNYGLPSLIMRLINIFPELSNGRESWDLG